MTDLTPELPAHIILDEAAGDAKCGICHMGINVSGVTGRGWVSRSDMLAALVVQHSVHDRKGFPSGLTPMGRASKAARMAMGGHA